MQLHEELSQLKNLLASTGIGTWRFVNISEDTSGIYLDDKLKEILGIPKELGDDPVECWNWLTSRIEPEDVPSVREFGQKIFSNQKAEVIARWMHPVMGERYMRCGGSTINCDQAMANGYLMDMTEQVRKEMRNSFVMKALASTYLIINYINLKEDNFITYTCNEIADEDMISMLMCGTATSAVEYGCAALVYEEDRDKMLRFLDFSNINERMSVTNYLSCAFRSKKGVWHRCYLLVSDRDEDGTIHSCLWALRQIDDKMQEELKRRKQLEANIAANKAKTKFLQNMSHEIRTPLNAMFGFAQLLGMPDGSWTEEEKDQYNGYVYNSYNMLDLLISDILDSADSEHGNYRMNLTETNVNSVCRNAIVSVEFRRPASVEILFNTNLSDDYTIQSDSRRIQQILINYLTNACKFTEKGQIKVEVSDALKPGLLTFSVTDTGKGVPVEKAEEIFGRFTKLNEYVQGSGLGLNICHMIASKLGGSVYLDTSYTGGARFVFELKVNRNN